jgi:hypothetical protein
MKSMQTLYAAFLSGAVIAMAGCFSQEGSLGGVGKGEQSVNSNNNTVPETCGGLAGLVCPTNYTCTQDPNYDCNLPADDCHGVCIENIHLPLKTCGGWKGTASDCSQGQSCIAIPHSSGEPATDGVGMCVDNTTCGGIANLQCPTGKVCVDDTSDSCDPNNGGNDCSGVCVTDTNPPVTCGGILGTPCPSGQKCVDDPSDSCDPLNGGADCSGICKQDTSTTSTTVCGGFGGPLCATGYSCVKDPNSSCGPEVDCAGICLENSILPLKTCGSFSGETCAQGQACVKIPNSSGEPATDGVGMCVDNTMCGGIANFLCPTGKTCVDDPNDNCDPNNGGADCSGICVTDPNAPIACGGFAATPCPSGKTCVDDPSDNCDPKNGGADCAGICQ